MNAASRSAAANGAPQADPGDARRRVAEVRAADAAADALGIELVDVELGRVELRLTIGGSMTNAHDIPHGGYVFLLADTAFAYCCISVDRLSVTRSADITFIAAARLGSVLKATATVHEIYGRNTVCDVTIRTLAGALVADFRGHGTLTASTRDDDDSRPDPAPLGLGQ